MPKPGVSECGHRGTLKRTEIGSIPILPALQLAVNFLAIVLIVIEK